ncbi:MAG: hypothetical protein JW704_12145, partial [Anaerolineaceae bacterium]|nr:hypothetical protein [Anaerolineaceae bacterium]
MATLSTPTFDNSLLKDILPERKITWLERVLGPENYRIVKGLLKTPASIVGFILIGTFILIAVFAPAIAPPVTSDPYKIPRDGFSSKPQGIGTEWSKNVPDIPFWYTPLTGKTEWVHLMGTAQGQYDIFYGIIWGTRTAFRTGLMVVISTFIIGIIIGSISAFYGGLVDNIIMRIVDVFMTMPFIMMALIMAAVLTPVLGRSLLPSILALIS